MQEIIRIVDPAYMGVNQMSLKTPFRSTDAIPTQHLSAPDSPRPLYNELTPQDHSRFLVTDSSRMRAGDARDIKLTDIEKDKSIVLDRSKSEEDRAKAAHELFESGIKEFDYKDEQGVSKTFKIKEEQKDGRKQLSLDDGNGFETSFDYVQDEHGNWVFVPHQGSGGGASSKARDHAGASDGPASKAPGHGGAGGGGGGGGGGFGGESQRVPVRPRGMSYSANDSSGVGHYDAPSGGRNMMPGGVDSHVWHGIQNTDGSVAIRFRGCQVDTDGAGARNHPEDATRQNQTSLKLSNGESLNTDTDNFFVLPPSVARAFHIKKGDLGWLVDEKTGKAVPVVFGDAGPEGKLGEASVHALKSLGFSNVSGRNGVDKSQPFKVVFVPGSGDGTGDIARDSQAMAAKLERTGKAGGAVQLT